MPNVQPATPLKPTDSLPPPVVFTDPTGEVWEFTSEGVVTGDINKVPFETHRYQVKAKPGFDRAAVTTIATAAFADRHGGRELREMFVDGPSYNRFYVAFTYGPTQVRKGQRS